MTYQRRFFYITFCLLLSTCITSSAEPSLGARKPFIPKFDTQDFFIVWHAPFGRGSANSAEAIDMCLALEDLYPGRVKIIHANEITDLSFWTDLEDGVKARLEKLIQREPAANLSVAVCSGNPGGWGYLEGGIEVTYSTTACPHDRNYPVVIGRTNFYTDRVPRDWEKRIKTIASNVFLPSQHSALVFGDSLKTIGYSNVHVMRVPINLNLYKPHPWETDQDEVMYLPECPPSPSAYIQLPNRLPAASRDALTESLDIPMAKLMPQCRFLFLAVMTWEDHPNPIGLLEAFLAAFPEPSDGACLIIKTRENYIEQHSKIPRHLIPGLPAKKARGGKPAVPSRRHILVLTETLGSYQMRELMHLSDAFIAPFHGDGSGRTLLEAMAVGLPVVATHWGAALDFLHENISYPVEPAGLAAATNASLVGHKWAAVDHLAVAKRLVEVFEDPSTARQKGACAAAYVAEHYDARKIAADFGKELHEIVAKAMRHHVKKQKSQQLKAEERARLKAAAVVSEMDEESTIDGEL